jgi:hypothetical protein
MRKVQEQESKLSKMSSDDKKKQEFLSKRKEVWEEKLKKKRFDVTNVSLIVDVG